MFSKRLAPFVATTLQCRMQSSTRILVGMSATKFGDAALTQAVRMAKDGDTIVGIFVPPALDPNAFPPNALQAMKDRQTKQLQDLNARAARIVSDAQASFGTKAKFESKLLAPSTNRRQAIVDACWNMKADVLVLGSLGAGAERNQEGEKLTYDEQRYEPFYHAVAHTPDFAMHNAPCPVLIVKPKVQN